LTPSSPSAAKNLKGKDAALMSLQYLYADRIFERVRKLLAAEGEKVIDSAKNMVALEPLLHFGGERRCLEGSEKWWRRRWRRRQTVMVIDCINVGGAKKSNI
jgi:hypothetical protein